MWLFWIVAAAAAAAAALLVAGRAAGAARGVAVGGEDPALAAHRRQLAELDDLAGRELIAPAELEAARAEAGRRLLAAADAPSASERPGGRRSRLLVTAGAAAAALIALALYLVIGRPTLPDAPYAQRLKMWRGADPATLDPARMAAVLQSLAAERPNDPQLFDYIGRADMAAGDAGGAARAFQHAATLDPRNSDYPAAAGEALLAGGTQEGKIPPEAEAAFREALARDPKNPAARYHLARARMTTGDVAGGLAEWRALAADLPANDPRKSELLAEIAHASGEGAPKPPGSAMPDLATVAAAAQSAPAAGPEQQAFIRGMVARLDARLQAQPDDPDGWVRLVRAYRVLGDAAAERQALDRARRALAKRPADLAAVEAQAR